uniref:Cytochrome b6-f complex subunit 6 n=1 Tax=Aneura mirabilis TaxID=280810 RepID=B0YPP6_ANEMR|nr:cytochrome b6/f complex subunit VI [Aneura mirabilis]ABS54493.1 cytochrome b6/f complex subunit VI [Aneura mirabilis]ACH56462.1 cytochrome b6/f complex small subunit [Aneura mirabilis]ACH56463.1 cytochrome b6/f complex small subunit [Aneura mirabilis]ACH56464.1 cytochrome b6/f complex small subunit [Aneura mirabilis]ACH56465.1 cytochrome b6/f complex small subunit [Aneura mirabilis]
MLTILNYFLFLIGALILALILSIGFGKIQLI